MRRAPRLVQLPKRRLHLVEVPLTRIRQPDARVASFKQRNAKLFLQTRDLAANAGLPDSEHFGRPSQASVLDGGYEMADFRKLGYG